MCACIHGKERDNECSRMYLRVCVCARRVLLAKGAGMCQTTRLAHDPRDFLVQSGPFLSYAASACDMKVLIRRKAPEPTPKTDL